MAIFIVPSELRSTSNLLKHISDVDYKELPGLEALTGADVMISPDGLPFPRNDNHILSHIKSGAKLEQYKFGHDLPLSIMDGRWDEALSRMLRITNEHTWQCLAVFVGMLGRDETKGMATINGQLTYGKRPMKWSDIDQAINYWMERGGIYYNLPSGKLVAEHLVNAQKRINYITSGNDVRTKYPAIPLEYELIEPTNPHLKKWKAAQKLVIVDDLRSFIRSIPGAKIGPERANAIWDYMKEEGIRQCFMGFLSLVREGDLIKVPGIGKGTLETIRWGLFRTLEERNERDKR